MIRLISLILLTIIQVSGQNSRPVKEPVDLISTDSLKKHISYLGNDSLEGRGTGTIGGHYLLYKTGAQTFVPNPAPLVFVGYGIIAPEYDYNDYQRVDVEREIVIKLKNIIDRYEAVFYFIFSFQHIIGEIYD